MMNKQFLLHEMVVEEKQICTDLYDLLSSKNSDLPKGSLYLRKDGMCRYVRENGKQFMIPVRGDDTLVDELRLRRFLKEGLPRIEGRIDACDAFLKKEKFYDPLTILGSLPAQYQDLKDDKIWRTEDIDPEVWKRASYVKNSRPFEEKHFTANGVQCRSKSEAMIGTRLEQSGIPYRYEPRVVLKWRTVYPDFALLLERVRRVAYLEHFGMIGDPDYSIDSMDKLDAFTSSGYLVGYDVFFTYETKYKPLNMKTIDRVIDEILRWDNI